MQLELPIYFMATNWNKKQQQAAISQQFVATKIAAQNEANEGSKQRVRERGGEREEKRQSGKPMHSAAVRATASSRSETVGKLASRSGVCVCVWVYCPIDSWFAL